MNAQTKHTATPYEINRELLQQTTSRYIWSLAHNKQIAIAQGGNDKESEVNAEFIVRACNAHDALVEALYKVLCWETESPTKLNPELKIKIKSALKLAGE